MDIEWTESRNAVAIVVTENGQFFVIRRSQHVRAPGKICFPGGHVEPGESEPDAVRRELLEELNLACEPHRVLWRSQTSWGTNVAWWLAARTDQSPAQADATEIAEFMWLSADEMLAHPDLLESNRHFLAELSRGGIRLDQGS